MKKYIIRKYVLANSITEAIKKEKTASVDDVYLDKDSEPQVGAPAIGFDLQADRIFPYPHMKPKK